MFFNKLNYVEKKKALALVAGRMNGERRKWKRRVEEWNAK